MPDHVTEQIQRISNRLKKAIEQHHARSKALEKLQQENDHLKSKETELHQEIRTLKEQVFLLKASSDPLQGEDKKEFEKMINEYINAIDKCIAKLKR